MYNAEEPFWGRTLRIIREIWPLGAPDELQTKIAPNLPDSDIPLLRQFIDACLEGKGGEVSARSRAADLGRAYLVLDNEGRKRFLELLAYDYGVDNEAVGAAISHRNECNSPQELEAANEQLRNLLEAPRIRLLRQFNELSVGVKFLVDLRAELLPLTKADHRLKMLDKDVHRLLVSWFDIGFLDLRRITWDTPAAILEKLIQYESVHEISSWKDLKNRLRADRRCYAFFHPRMVNEPLIFVEVALVEGLSDNIQVLLDLDNPETDPEKADTAIFYSISNCQKGLAGVSFGNFLIKRVVADLATKHPNLRQFSTLSPIPGFMHWVGKNVKSIDIEGKERDLWDSIASTDSPQETIINMLMENTKKGNQSNSETLKNMLMGICASYLVEEKRNDKAYDRVAHFHLSNGARIERINWNGNRSQAGMEQSATMMVNYLYDLNKIERNHELYSGSGEISVSSSVKKLLH